MLKEIQLIIVIITINNGLRNDIVIAHILGDHLFAIMNIRYIFHGEWTAKIESSNFSKKPKKIYQFCQCRSTKKIISLSSLYFTIFFFFTFKIYFNFVFRICRKIFTFFFRYFQFYNSTSKTINVRICFYLKLWMMDCII